MHTILVQVVAQIQLWKILHLDFLIIMVLLRKTNKPKTVNGVISPEEHIY